MGYGDSSAEIEDARLMERGTVTVSSLGDFRQAIQEARAIEREECAKIMMTHPLDPYWESMAEVREDIAAAIRARGNR